jgi:hypothetical protein
MGSQSGTSPSNATRHPVIGFSPRARLLYAEIALLPPPPPPHSLRLSLRLSPRTLRREAEPSHPVELAPPSAHPSDPCPLAHSLFMRAARALILATFQTSSIFSPDSPDSPYFYTLPRTTFFHLPPSGPSPRTHARTHTRARAHTSSSSSSSSSQPQLRPALSLSFFSLRLPTFFSFSFFLFRSLDTRYLRPSVYSACTRCDFRFPPYFFVTDFPGGYSVGISICRFFICFPRGVARNKAFFRPRGLTFRCLA